MAEKIDVTAQINILIKLQDIDAQIYRLNEEKLVKPQEIARLDTEFKEKTADLKKAEEKFTALQLKKKEKEGALSTKEDQIRKFQTQLSQIKTNKEYSAMQHEIESHKADKSITEDEILVLMDEIDRAKLDVAKEKEILGQEESQLKEKQKQVKIQLEEIDKDLQRLAVDRQVILPQADAAVLKKYEKILASKNGLALVAVNGDACQGCHMNLPPQVINQIKLKHELIICENCTRFLYINEPAG